MSALGHKRTFPRVSPMSTLPPKAVDQQGCDVRFVPKAATDARFTLKACFQPNVKESSDFIDVAVEDLRGVFLYASTRPDGNSQCPLLGVKRTLAERVEMS